MKKQSILEQWRNRNKKVERQKKGIQKRPADVDIPLSFGQERLWFLQQLYPNNPFYHYAETYKLKGQLDADSLQQSFEHLTQRYEILRSNFQVVNGKAIQIVQPSASVFIERIDLRQIADDAQRAQLERQCLKAATQPFDLTKNQLFRIHLFQLAEEEHVLLLTMHHIITDKWSMNVLRQELAACYNHFLKNETPDLPVLPYQFPDYAYWQRQQQQNEKHLAYWKEKLSGNLPVLELPYDFPRPTTNTFKGNYHEQSLSLELSVQLKTLSKELGVTLYVLMLAAYKVLLQKYTSTDDVIVGSPISNRDQSSLEQQIGFFNETIALRTQLDKDFTFKDLVTQVNQTTVAAFQHKNTPFDQIVKAINPDRAQSVNPIFQVMFILHHVPKTPRLEGDLQLVHEPFDFGVCKFDLTLYVSDEGEQLRTLFEYASDVFAEATIVRMQAHYKHILEQIISNPNTKLADIELITPQEKQQILHDWNDTATALEAVENMPQLLEKMAAQFPNHTAVSDKKNSLSYQTLHESSNNFAHQLLEKGLQANQVVGLFVERSVEMLVGIWTILKAGGAYLPIDPDYPKERIRFLLEDADLSIVLTQSKLKDALPDDLPDLIALDTADNKEKNISTPHISIQKEQLAYLIYTSGSTGRPKGVAVTHGNLLHSTLARKHYYPDSPSAFLLLSSFAFDSSVAGIFWTTCTGGHLVLPPKRIEQDLYAFGQLIAKHQITHTLLLPSLYNTILNYIPIPQLQSLKTVVVAGEACTRNLSHLHFEQLPNTRLYNEYGPTEASVWCIAHELQADSEDLTVPIGRPIPNAKAYILNEQLQPMPVGVVGDLYIGGLGIAQGYWQREDLTSERFSPNPFSENEADRMYKTGDLARYRADGTIDFLGRKDRQVKVRGYRIELEEVRYAIKQQKAVEEAVVAIHQAEDQQQSASLLSFVKTKERLNADSLRSYLKDHLPNYMIPASFQFVETFPTLPNGKIDTKALLENYAAKDTEKSAYHAPSSELEKTLTAIWEEVLNQESIGIHNNFFEIGGDSILSIQIIAKARKAGISLSANALFEHQNIAELALFAAFDNKAKSKNELVTGESQLLPIQHWFFEEHQHAPAHWNQAFRFDVVDNLQIEKIEEATQYLVQQHDVLRLKFVQEAEAWKSYYVAPEQSTVFHQYDLSDVLSEEQEHLIEQALKDLQNQFDLSKGNLFKVLYFQCGAKQADHLILLAHHLVVDAISWQILIADFKAIYEQLLQSPTPTLSAKTLSYQAWGKTLQTWVEAGKFDAELAYWQQQSTIELPTDFEVSTKMIEANAQTAHATFDKDYTQKLLTEIHDAYNTKVEDILIAGLLLALQKQYRLSKVSLALERHGREDLETQLDFSESVGWFTSQFPITISTKLHADLGDFIKSVKEQIRSIPNKGIGYGVLRYLSKREELHQSFALNFNYLGQVMQLQEELLGTAHFIQKNMRHPQSERHCIWEINASIKDQKLHLNWTYSEERHQAASIQNLLTAFQNSLKELIDHCLQTEDTAYTPSDFPEINFSQEDLDSLLEQL